MTTDVDYCTVWGCGGDTGVYASSLRIQNTGASDLSTMNVYNTIGSGSQHNNDWSDGHNYNNIAVGTITWNGSHNLRTSALTDLTGTDNLTNWQDRNHWWTPPP